ncbi:FecR domain-containing protein [Reichenbachiella sp. MALMAid0571]|uniref:FecR family protein n=1 Tax=Reichenbachiella sp. MALMAid0571 TaxID=3143939 RepID=UPI0032DE9E0F
MDNNKKNIEQIVDEFFQGKESKLGRELFNKWYQSNGKELQEIPDKETIKKEIFQSISQKVFDNSSNYDETLKRRSRSLVLPVVLKIAASFVLLLGFTYLFYNKSEVISIQKESITQVEKSNSRGERSTFRLPDGTIVKLNSDSRLRFNEAFDIDKREVYLEGEAFFDVVKDSKRPFRVFSSGVVTTALGTSFNVKAFNTDKLNLDEIEVSLVTGKVNVHNEESNTDLILIPGEQAVIRNTKGFKRTFDELEILGWKDGVVHFKDTDFNEIVSELERWYDVDFEVNGLSESEGHRLKGTGKFNTQKQTLTTILEVLSHSMNFQYDLTERKVSINF